VVGKAAIVATVKPHCSEMGRINSNHIPPDLVVDHWTSAVESSSLLDFL
jgi:hypothetical protein